ncbi:MAG: ImmA/IrrE family metallo-endopeptidase [Bryobacteraceae bacterium]|nr:ImmA/IrrE family metallo-endopeptidase [Bryobacteraceae bacterium]
MLAEYGNRHGQVTAPPVPIDDIVEGHLKLAIEFRNLQADYPEGDVLGCIWFNDKKIAIDRSLVPEDYPAMLGRYRFTLAHELAQWRLHRHLYLHRANEQSLFPSGAARPDHVLRSRQSAPLQANRLARCLLMPREMVKRAWHARRGGMAPIYLPDLRAGVGDLEVRNGELEVLGAHDAYRASGDGLGDEIVPVQGRAVSQGQALNSHKDESWLHQPRVMGDPRHRGCGIARAEELIEAQHEKYCTGVIPIQSSFGRDLL